MGVQILNKDISVVSSVLGKPKASINNVINTSGWASGGTFVPGDFAFNDGAVDYTTNTVTFTKSGRLYIEGSSGELKIQAYGYLNGVGMNFFTTTASANSNPNTFAGGSGNAALISFARYGVFDVVAGNTMYFYLTSDGEAGYDSGDISFRITSFAGTLIDSFTPTYSGCYLTTATVKYKGLLDDGPELTAMRALREHYRGDTYYDNLIVEYYQNAGAIIQGIDNSVNPSVDYEFIYQSVLKVQNYVEQSMWEEAKDEYLSTYFILKAKYI